MFKSCQSNLCECVCSHLRHIALDPLSIRQDFIPHDYTPSKSLWGQRKTGYQADRPWKGGKSTDRKMCMSTHSHSGTLTLNSKNSGLIKSSRNQVSGGFSQSAIALVNKNRKRQEGVNVHLCQTLNQYTDIIIWGLKNREPLDQNQETTTTVTEKQSFDLIPVREDLHNA